MNDLPARTRLGQGAAALQEALATQALVADLRGQVEALRAENRELNRKLARATLVIEALEVHAE